MTNIGIIVSFLISFITFLAYAEDIKRYNPKTIKVAVIDTGFDFNSNWVELIEKHGLRKPNLCSMGHRDFTGTGIQDNHSHGTHVAGIIAKYAGNSNYCLVILKTYNTKKNPQNGRINTLTKAIRYATKIGVDIIHYSGGGLDFQIDEYFAVKKALNKGIVFVAAAGNKSKKINHHIQKVSIRYLYTSSRQRAVYAYTPYFINRETSEITKEHPQNMYYPAAYDPRIISVKNIDKSGRLAESSNRGAAFVHKEIGTNVYSITPRNSASYMTGTSQAAPARTGKIIKSWKK